MKELGLWQQLQGSENGGGRAGPGDHPSCPLAGHTQGLSDWEAS